jgi:hypothetical protein
MTPEKQWCEMMPIVIVWWRDSASFPTWHPEEMVQNLTPDEIVSTGFLFVDVKDHIVLVQSRSESTNMDNVITIPCAAIRRMKVIQHAIQENRTKRVRKARK